MNDDLQKLIEYQGHKSNVNVTLVFVIFCVHDTARTSWSGFTKCCTGI